MTARILVIDDDHPVRQAIRMALETQGYEVDEACNGHDALDRVRIQVPQLILCDIFMPHQDGFDTIRALRRECPAVPIVAMSGGGSIGGSEALRMARHLGAADVLHKPLYHAGLFGLIQRLVPKSRAP